MTLLEPSSFPRTFKPQNHRNLPGLVVHHPPDHPPRRGTTRSSTLSRSIISDPASSRTFSSGVDTFITPDIASIHPSSDPAVSTRTGSKGPDDGRSVHILHKLRSALGSGEISRGTRLRKRRQRPRVLTSLANHHPTSTHSSPKVL